MASGMNKSKWLETHQMYAGRVDVPKAPVSAIYAHPKGHPLHHPRIDYPIREDLVVDIMERGITDPILVRINWAKIDGKEVEVLELCDGAQRFIHGKEAEDRLRKQVKKGDKWPKPLNEDGVLPVKLEFFNGSDKEFLLERQRRDRQPWKLQHTVTVLAKSILAMHKLEATTAEILDVLPKGWAKKTIEAVINGWHTLDKSTVKRFDDGEATVAMLAAVLETAPGERESVLTTLIENKVQSPAAATRLLGRLEREEAAETTDTPAATVTERTPTRGDGGKPPRTKKAPTPGQALRTDAVQKVVTFAENVKLTKNGTSFFLLAEMAALLDFDNHREYLKRLDGLDPIIIHAALGLMWRKGIWTDRVQALADAKVLETIENARAKKNKDDDSDDAE